VQGQLRGEPLKFHIETQCGHCGEPLTLDIDSQLNIEVAQPQATPMVFVPMVDFARLEDPSIIDAF
jgi:hypothetical protein